MNIVFSEKEKRKLLEFINKKPLNEQKWLDDVIASAKNANLSFIKNSPDISVPPNFTKNLDEIKTKLSRVENSLNTKTLFKSDDINSSINLWTNTISNYTRSIFKNSSLDLDILVKYVTGDIVELPGDVVKKLNNNQISILSNLKAYDKTFKLRANEMSADYKKLLTDKAKKYIEIHGQEKYNKLLADYKSKKIDTDGMFKELENTTPTKETPKQVAGVKLSDIPEDEFEVIEAALKSKGWDKDWGFDPNTGDLAHVTLQIDGKEVKFSLNKVGPEEFDWEKIWTSELWDESATNWIQSLVDEYNKVFEGVDWYSKPTIDSWVKEEKILKDPNLRQKYTHRYQVPLGVRMSSWGLDGTLSNWVIINPEAIKLEYNVKDLNKLKDNIYHVIYHELTHVIQKPSYHSSATYKSSWYNDAKDAWAYMTGKKSNVKKEDVVVDEEFFDVWEWQRSDRNKAEEWFSEFGKEKNIDVSKDYSWLDDFKVWAMDKGIVDSKFITKRPITQSVTKYDFNTNMFSNDVKVRALRKAIDEWALRDPDYKKIKDRTDKLNDSDLLKFIENNLDSNRVDYIVRDAANELSYWSHIREIEAEVGANMKTILELGTLEQNKGFATWLVDWLRGTNKSEKLADINLTREKAKLDASEAELDSKYPYTSKSYLDSGNFDNIKNIFINFIKKFLGKTIDDPKKLNRELSSVDGWVNNIPDDFFKVLKKLETRWKRIYPEQAKKIEKDFYRQAYELISKGYPALLPFIAGGLDELGGSEEGSVKNESIRYKKSYITEGIKKTYSFDWDDNILNMPTRIHLEYKVGGLHWVPVSVSTEQFRSIRHKLGTEFRYLNDNILDAFKDFREYGPFIKDVKRALDTRSFGPSFNDFKEALINGEDFSIITARSNSPKYFIEAIKLIIDYGLSYSEKMEMTNNLKGTSVEDYLKIQDYYPVTSDEFLQSFNLDVNVSSPEVGKEIAFESFVDKVVNQIEMIKDDPSFEGISVGYSDDDPGNIEVIINLIKTKLSKKYSQIHFNVYDTSDPNNPKKKRIVIEK